MSDHVDELRTRFRELHTEGLFVMPNPWDVGSAVRLAELGFEALATTSSGFAWSLGKQDREVTLDELLPHVAAIVAAVDVPLNVDSERCFADDPGGVARTVQRLAEAGASGCSIEDYDPATGAIDDIAKAAERVAAAAEAAAAAGMTLTARAENLLHGVTDLDDTISRLVAYRDAGAPVLYAPGLRAATDITRVATAVERPLNVLLLPNGPSIGDLRAAGVRRVSTGGALARAAYATLTEHATPLLDTD